MKTTATLDTNTLNRKAPGQVIMSFNFKGDEIGAPGRIILQWRPSADMKLGRNEYVTHWQNRQDGGCHSGGYYTSLGEALKDFGDRCAKEAEYAERRGDSPWMETYDSIALVSAIA